MFHLAREHCRNDRGSSGGSDTAYGLLNDRTTVS